MTARRQQLLRIRMDGSMARTCVVCRQQRPAAAIEIFRDEFEREYDIGSYVAQFALPYCRDNPSCAEAVWRMPSQMVPAELHGARYVAMRRRLIVNAPLEDVVQRIQDLTQQEPA